MQRLLCLALTLGSAVLAACGAADDRGTSRWAGTIDTLASGQIVVTNPATPSWAPGSEWRVVEELRIGRLEGDGPDLFGQITSLTVDRGGRIWVLEGQAQELRVFSPAGEFIRTVGRRGGGPGEFKQAVRIDLAPDGNLWVMDPPNNRLSVFDTAGHYLEGKNVPGGFMILPWPGGFDTAGRYYAPSPLFGPNFRTVLVRHDAALVPIDTLEAPTDPIERDRFEIRRDGVTRIAAGVPYQGGLVSRLSPAGTQWALLTDQYRLFELGERGDTLRTVTRAFTPLRVTEADRERARDRLKWFTDQGGKPDWSKIPSTRPLADNLSFDDEGNVWVAVVSDSGESGWEYDIFDPEGRYLGVVRLPFRLAPFEARVFRQGMLYGVTRDELEVPYLVVARVVKP
jgi:streptogramin lyase